MNLLAIFFTGLTTGGLSCLAMQGGLLTSVIANQKNSEFSSKEKTKENRDTLLPTSFDELDWLPVSLFLIAKLGAHAALGFLLGWVGSKITLSLEVRLIFQVFTAFFMFATAMNLLDVHPIFRFVSFQPPKSIGKFIRNTSKQKALFAPAILGVLTIFIPCGVTQAMEVLAINSGNPIQGMLIMSSFVVGTMPLFATIGIATAKLAEAWHATFTKVAAYTLIFLAYMSVNGVLIVLNSPLSSTRLLAPVREVFSGPPDWYGNTSQFTNNAPVIQVLNTGYSPNSVRVKRGVPVTLTLQSNDTYSCALSFVFKEFGIKTFLKSTDSQTFTFTPQKTGKFTFTCSMGMYTGTLEVVE